MVLIKWYLIIIVFAMENTSIQPNYSYLYLLDNPRKRGNKKIAWRQKNRQQQRDDSRDTNCADNLHRKSDKKTSRNICYGLPLCWRVLYPRGFRVPWGRYVSNYVFLVKLVCSKVYGKRRMGCSGVSWGTIMSLFECVWAEIMRVVDEAFAVKF